jgi:hypothetical protein
LASDDTLLRHAATLERLERELHTPEVRGAARRLAALLHPEFVEIGRSGRTYSRDEVLGEFSATPFEHVVWSQDYVASTVIAGVILLTYRTAHVGSDGALDQFTARASLWQQTPAGWQLRFHQGTPTEPFERAAGPL